MLESIYSNREQIERVEWLNSPIQPIHATSMAAARAYQAELTKPEGSLGVLESIAIRCAGMQGRQDPSIEHVSVHVFAADHGIASEGVSAFPQAVTREMVRNFSRGGAAISVLADNLDADFKVTLLGTAEAVEPLPHVEQRIIAPMTANFARQPAMSREQLEQAFRIGKQVADELVEKREAAPASTLLVAGEMGIGNTASATAVATVLLGEEVTDMVGRGTGLDEAGVARKAEVIKKALLLHGLHRGGCSTQEEVIHLLATVGGFEIVALTGCYLRCGQQGIPVVVDGFIASTAALAAAVLNPDVKAWFFYGHLSAEYGHKAILNALGGEPLLQLNMRLGEASGAALAVSIIQQALALHNRMATFRGAEVSESLS